MPQPYRVVPRGTGCRRCKNGEQYEIIGPGEIAQSQSWGDREEAKYICGLMNDAYWLGARVQKTITAKKAKK